MGHEVERRTRRDKDRKKMVTWNRKNRRWRLVNGAAGMGLRRGTGQLHKEVSK